jgi:hypothetical protein
LRGYLAFDHQSGSGWFDDAHRALQRAGRPPRVGVDAKPFDEVFGDDVCRA